MINGIVYQNFIEQLFCQIGISQYNSSENSNWETPVIAENLVYSKNDPELLDFADWLSDFIKEERFADGVSHLKE